MRDNSIAIKKINRFKIKYNVKNKVRKKKSFNDTISLFMRFVYKNHLYKFIWFLIYIASHFFCISIFTNYDVVDRIITYESFWYIANLLMLFFPYILDFVINKKMSYPEKSIIDFNTEKNKIINWSFILLAIIVFLNLMYGLFSGAKELFFEYGEMYAVIHFIYAVLFCGPCFFNMFYVSYTFWSQMRNKFTLIESKKDLMDIAPKLIYHFKNMTICYGLGYFAYWIIVILAFSSTGFLRKFIDSILSLNFNYDLTMGIMYLFLPIIIPLIYYILTTRNIKKFLMESIIKANSNDEFSEQDHKMIQITFYDRNSSFYLGGIFSYYILPLIVPTTSIVFETLINRF